MPMQIAVLGASFHTAEVDRRERLALDAEQTLRVLAAIRHEAIFQEAVVLSTCNRTEVCYVAPDAGQEGHFLEHLAEVTGAAAADESIFYRHCGPAAVTHVFRVAAALDSQVVGEHEILGQLKDAYRLAVEAHTAGFLLHKLMHRAFRVGKRVQSETNLGRGNASIPQVAVALAESLHGSLDGLTVMLVGAGKAAELAAAALLRNGATRLIVANRTPARAAELAKRLTRNQETCSLRKAVSENSQVQVRAVGLEDIPSHIGQVELVISSTAAGQAVLTMENVGKILRRGGGGHGQGLAKKVLMIDLAVPRNIDPHLAELAGVQVVNIDDLRDRTNGTIARRRLEIPVAETIVAEEAQRFSRWLDSLQAAPIIKRLQEQIAALRQAQIDRYCGKHPSTDRRELETFARSLTRQALHNPLTFLKKLSAERPLSADLSSLDLVRRMFDLEDGQALHD
jgi:glutamyl-tRNA reductase